MGNEVNSRRQYAVLSFVFETLSDDEIYLSIAERGVKPRECAPTEEGEERPEGGNSSDYFEAIGFTPRVFRDSFREMSSLDCSPIVSRSFLLKNLKVFSASTSLFFFSFFLFFYESYEASRWKREKLSRSKEMRPCFDNEILWCMRIRVRLWRRRSFDSVVLWLSNWC